MARDLQQRINPINAAVTSAFGVPGLKAALDLTGFVGGAPRLPLLPPDRQTVDKLRDLLAPLADFLS